MRGLARAVVNHILFPLPGSCTHYLCLKTAAWKYTLGSQFPVNGQVGGVLFLVYGYSLQVLTAQSEGFQDASPFIPSSLPLLSLPLVPLLNLKRKDYSGLALAASVMRVCV